MSYDTRQVSDAVIEEGMRALADWVDIDDPLDEPKIVRDIYLAMKAADQPQLPQPVCADVRGAIRYLREEMLDAEEDGEPTVRVRCDMLRTALDSLEGEE